MKEVFRANDVTEAGLTSLHLSCDWLLKLSDSSFGELKRHFVFSVTSSIISVFLSRYTFTPHAEVLLVLFNAHMLHNF